VLARGEARGWLVPDGDKAVSWPLPPPGPGGTT